MDYFGQIDSLGVVALDQAVHNIGLICWCLMWCETRIMSAELPIDVDDGEFICLIMQHP